MIIYKNAYFLDLGKTGTSFAEDILNKCLEVNLQSSRLKRHQGFTHLPSEQWFKNNLVFATVRNPLTYYVSHLAYSRKTNGPILKELISQGYRDSDYPNSVEGYVHSMMIDRLNLPANNHNNPEREAWRNMPDDLGMMTMQYILLLDKDFILEKKRTTKEIEDWYEQYWFNENMKNLIFVGRKNLTEELIDLISNKTDYFGEVDEKILSYVKANSYDKNSHKIQNLNYADWHNQKSIDIITYYERILFDNLEFRKGFDNELT